MHKILIELRKTHNLSQAQVAKAIGIDRTTYLRYENGESTPNKKLKELSRLYNVSIDYILGNDVTEHPFYVSRSEQDFLNEWRLLNAEDKEEIMALISFKIQRQKNIEAV